MTESAQVLMLDFQASDRLRVEEQMQKTIVAKARALLKLYGQDEEIIFSLQGFPESCGELLGAECKQACIQNAKAKGVVEGIPDLFIDAARFSYRGLYCELKTSIGELRDSQKTQIKKLKERGYCVVVKRSVQSALLAIFDYLFSKEDDLLFAFDDVELKK